MNQIEVRLGALARTGNPSAAHPQDLPLTERKANLFWVLYERQNVKETKSEDKLDADSNVYKRTKETVRRLEPY
jgi:hypothetical protein